MIEMKEKLFRYNLTIIDIFSRYGFAVPLKTKTGEVAKTLQIIFKQRKPTHFLQSDDGKEFVNKKVQNLLQENKIYWFSTRNHEMKAQIVERFNRTLKTKMYKYFTANNTKKWVEVLPSLVENYNNSYHRTIKMTPTEASKQENSAIVFENLYDLTRNEKKPKFKVGDDVRISKYKTIFNKGYKANFTKEIFSITEVLKTNPFTYNIKDENNEIIIGSFYENELVKVSV